MSKTDWPWRVKLSFADGAQPLYYTRETFASAWHTAAFLDSVNPFSGVTMAIEHRESGEWVPCKEAPSCTP